MHYSEFLFQYIYVIFERLELSLENQFICRRRITSALTEKHLYPGTTKQIKKEGKLTTFGVSGWNSVSH